VGRGQGLQRAQVIVLGLAGLACRAGPEREPAGEAPPFHDQILCDSMLTDPSTSESLPIALPVDVRRDAIHVRRFDLSRQIFPRGGSREASWSEGVPVRVPGDDELLVWHQHAASTERRVYAARAEQPDQPWPLLDYVRGYAIAEPIVVGDRVAVMLADGIAHAPLQGGPPGLLALSQMPRGLLSSDAGRLVWIADQGERTFVMSTDASFASAEVEYEHRNGLLVGAVLVGESLVFASIDPVRDVALELVVRRKRVDGTLLEVLRGPAPGDELRLLADGTQAWLYTAHNLWWIGADSHAKIPEFTAEVTAIGADDGLLLWIVGQQLHVAGQPTVEFVTPLLPPPLHEGGGM
jgi:hypothetical protein